MREQYFSHSEDKTECNGPVTPTLSITKTHRSFDDPIVKVKHFIAFNTQNNPESLALAWLEFLTIFDEGLSYSDKDLKQMGDLIACVQDRSKQSKVESAAPQVIDGETEEGKSYYIQPKDINTTEHFQELFGLCEREVTARAIIEFCQHRGEWASLDETDIRMLKRQTGIYFDIKTLFRADGVNNLLVFGQDRRYRLTQKLIDVCAEKFPAT